MHGLDFLKSLAFPDFPGFHNNYRFPFPVTLVLKIPTRLSVLSSDRFLSVVGF